MMIWCLRKQKFLSLIILKILKNKNKAQDQHTWDLIYINISFLYTIDYTLKLSLPKNLPEFTLLSL